MRRLLTLMAIALAAQLFAAPQRGQNVLTNPSFERTAGAEVTAWQPVGRGYTVAGEGAQDGRACFTCESDTDDQTYGAMQELTFDPPIRHPFKVAGWSKCEGAAGSDYSLYMDCWYEDGTNLWGQRKDFNRGTHDWQYIEFVFGVEKPVSRIQYFILFRRCTGKAWFDNVSLSLAPFEVQRTAVRPSLYGGNSIDYAASLSLNAEWTASILRGARQVHTKQGTGQAVVLAWPGTDDDGRLLPGGDYTIRIAATDALLGEAIAHETAVKTRSGAGTGYVAWNEPSTKRVLEHQLPKPNVAEEGAPAANIALAGNEYESFQVALRAAPGKQLADCTVEITDLADGAGNAISRANIQWRQVGFVKVEQLHEHPFMSHAVPGWWPDPLLPVSKFTVPGGVTQSVWFTVYAPPGTPAGVYRGQVAFKPTNAPEYRTNVTARVYDFDIPTEPHIKTAFALMDGFLEKIYGELTPQLRQAYGDYVLNHRLNPDDISRTDPSAVEDVEHYYGSGLNAFNVINMVRPRGKSTWVCWSPLEVYTPAFKADLIKRLDPYVAELKARELIDKAYVYTFDERGKDFWPVMREYFGLIKERYGIPTLTTAKVPQDPDVMRDLNVDWNCPVSSAYRFEQAERCRKAGLQVWSYICLGPRFPYANWLADDPLIEARVIWWQAYQQKMDGFLYWGLNIWSRANNDYIIDPEKDGPRLKWSITTGGRWTSLHGDGELLYPGKDGPFGCIRLANIRDGIEDYEYLWLLSDLQGDVEAGRQACAPITDGLTSFTRDPDALYAQRDAIAHQIEKLLKGK